MSAITGMFFNWLVRTSWQAAVLVLIVFLIQSVFRRKLSARWRYALWLLVVFRLLLPAAPQSAVSLFNYAGLENMRGKPSSINASPVSSGVFRVAQVSDGKPAIEAGTLSAIPPSAPEKNYASPQTSAPASRDIAARRAAVVGISLGWENFTRFCALSWVIGVAFLILRLISQNIVFMNRLRTANVITDPRTQTLFEQCKNLIGVHFPIGLVETSEVTSPALHGFFRPRLLLPAQVIGGFSQQELRFIFLHELAHIKRRDMAVHWAATLLNILHWFNPVLWLGFRRMAIDRELACDELALSSAGEQERKPYGAAILKVLETCASSPGLPGVMGILEDKDQMARRISMILKFRPHSRRSILAVLLLLVLALVTLTDARSGPKAGAELKLKSLTPTSSESAQPQPGNAEKAVRPDLVGQVHANDGSPVAATVFIYTAGPKVGSSTFCPSCYADCRKREKSNARGDFKIDSLNPQLIFRILVVAKGYEPKFADNVDPAA